MNHLVLLLSVAKHLQKYPLKLFPIDDVNDEIRKLMKLSKEDQYSSKENKEDAEFLLEDYDSECSDDDIEEKFIEKISGSSVAFGTLQHYAKFGQVCELPLDLPIQI